MWRVQSVKEVNGMVVDRIEGDLAIVEIRKGCFENIPVDRITGHVRDGVMLVPDGDGYTVDENETKQQSGAVQARLSSLFDK